MPAPSARTVFVRALSRVPSFMLTCSLLSACGGKESSLPQRPAATYGIPQQRPTNTSTTPSGPSPEGNNHGNIRAAADQPPRNQEPPSAPEEAAAPLAPAQARDYGAELAALLSKGVPGCLASLKPSTESVSIQVSAYVMASGTVSRAEAQGSGLTPEVLACVKKLAGSVQMNSPVADAPRNVQTQITLRAQGTTNALPIAAPEDTLDDERDGDPRDSKVHHVDDNPAEVEQKQDEPTREAPEPPDPEDEPPADNHID